MRNAERYPAFAEGWIVIDARDAPSLRNAIGCKIFKTARGAGAKLRAARLARLDAEYLHAVPVNEPSGVFALDYIDADGVVVRPDGSIRLEM